MAGAVAAERLEGGEALVAGLALVDVEAGPDAVRRGGRLRVLAAGVPLGPRRRLALVRRRGRRKHHRRRGLGVDDGGALGEEDEAVRHVLLLGGGAFRR